VVAAAPVRRAVAHRAVAPRVAAVADAVSQARQAP
jgi:hypothetical protein